MELDFRDPCTGERYDVPDVIEACVRNGLEAWRTELSEPSCQADVFWTEWMVLKRASSDAATQEAVAGASGLVGCNDGAGAGGEGAVQQGNEADEALS